MKVPSIALDRHKAKAAFQLLNLCDVATDVLGMCFDTTASNTGTKSGACTLLEQLMQKTCCT